MDIRRTLVREIPEMPGFYIKVYAPHKRKHEISIEVWEQLDEPRRVKFKDPKEVLPLMMQPDRAIALGKKKGHVLIGEEIFEPMVSWPGWSDDLVREYLERQDWICDQLYKTVDGFLNFRTEHKVPYHVERLFRDYSLYHMGIELPSSILTKETFIKPLVNYHQQTNRMPDLFTELQAFANEYRDEFDEFVRSKKLAA